jgi:hypothetical protein
MWIDLFVWIEHGKDAKHISMDDMRQALTKANDAFSRGTVIL